MEEIERKHRNIVWIDMARGVAILGVVLEHTMSKYRIAGVKYVSGWAIVSFFFITGYLLRESSSEMGFDRSVVKLLKRLIRPYFILCGVNLVIELVRHWLAGEPSLSRVPGWVLGILYSETSQMPNCTPLWFLPCLFLVRLMMQLLLKKKTVIQIWAVTAALIIAELLIVFRVPRLPWNAGPALFRLIFCYWGHILRKYRLFEKLDALDGPQRWGILLAMAGLGVLAIQQNPVRLVLRPMRVGNPLLSIPGATLCGTAMMLLCRELGRREDRAICRVLSWIGQHTLFIMGFDFFTRTLVGDLLTAAGCPFFCLAYALRLLLLLGGCWIWNALVARIPRPGLRRALQF